MKKNKPQPFSTAALLVEAGKQILMTFAAVLPPLGIFFALYALLMNNDGAVGDFVQDHETFVGAVGLTIVIVAALIIFNKIESIRNRRT